MGDDGDRITNKDIIGAINRQTDNHLHHIQKYSEETSSNMKTLVWICKLLLGAMILWAIEHFILDVLHFGG